MQLFETTANREAEISRTIREAAQGVALRTLRLHGDSYSTRLYNISAVFISSLDFTFLFVNKNRKTRLDKTYKYI